MFKQSNFIFYMFKEFLSKRSRWQTLAGVVAVLASATSLMLLFSFESGIKQCLETTLFRARPVIYSLILKSQSDDGLFTMDDKALLLKRLNEYSNLVESVSWAGTIYGLDFQRNAMQSFSGAEKPEVWVLPDDSEFFSTNNGVLYLSGHPFASKAVSNSTFSVMANTHCFTRLYDVSDETVRTAIELGDISELPSSVFISFRPIETLPEYKPETIELPLTGIFHLPEDCFPDLIVSEDVGAAHFFNGINSASFDSSYALQLYDADGHPLCSDFRKDGSTYTLGTNVLDKNDFTVLPETREKLLEYEELTKNGLTPYDKAFIMIKPGASSLLSQENDEIDNRVFMNEELARSEVLVSTNLPDNRLFEEMDSRKRGKSLRIHKLLKACKLSGSGRLYVEIQKKGVRWGLEYDSGQRFTAIRDGAFLIVNRPAPWSISKESDTVTEALNRVTKIVDLYSVFSTIVIAVISMFIVLLFSYQHILRKRKDIGVLKSAGVYPTYISAQFGAQILLVCVAGILCGALLAKIILFFCEIYAQELILSLLPRIAGQKTTGFLDLKVIMIAKSALFLLSGAIMGMVLPFFWITGICPVKDLNTNV